MKRALFIDRDGTLIVEPETDFQVDSLEKLEFRPGVFRNLYMISQKLNYELVIVSNQDGLGTPGYPEESFIIVQQKMLEAFHNEGILFDDILIDRSLPSENAPTRKPATGMLTKYLAGGYDLKNSFVIGDRITDIELAKNLGTKAILYDPAGKRESIEHQPELWIARSWDEILELVSRDNRVARTERSTAETGIKVEVNLDGTGRFDITTGLGFFDHMLSQLARHSGCDMVIQVTGDLHVDEHHTIEDTALALGECFNQALGNKAGIGRYGFALPMDDSMAQVLIDFGGRPWLVWQAEFKREKIGEMPTEMFMHFFKSFCDTAKCNLNIKAEGTNEHHKIEAIFKALAKAIKMAVRKNPLDTTLPSTKGIL